MQSPHQPDPSDPLPRPERRRAPEISVITPTFNEAANITTLLDRLTSALAGRHYEIIVADDDSPDRTWEVAEAYAQLDPRVRVLRRFGTPGLSPAVLDAMSTANGGVLAVIDADGQHDETVLPAMLDRVRDGADIVVGSRSAPGGSYGEFTRSRRFVSWVATLIAQTLLRVGVGDPMSGFFAVSRATYLALGPSINPQGFKVLLEFLGRADGRRVDEVGYRFRQREAGETKLNPSVIRSYLLAVAELRLGRAISGHMLLYLLVGATGVMVNAIGYAFGERLGLGHIDTGIGEFLDPVEISVLVGAQLSICSNFLLNNYFTFWERRFRRRYLVAGFALFEVVSVFGIVVHLAVFHFLQQTGAGFELLGRTTADFLHNQAGAVAALVSNYFLNLNYTWRRRRPIE